MANLQGLKGLYSDPQTTDQFMDEGVLEAKANALDSEHSEYGTQHMGYSGTVPDFIPYSPQSVYDGYDPGFVNQFGGMDYQVFGEEIDRTPTTHSSPYPRGIIQEGIAGGGQPGGLHIVNEQMRDLHGPDLGGVAFLLGEQPSGHEEETNYTTERYDAPNENYLTPDIPGQLRAAGNNGVGASGHGNADPTQGYGVLNTLPEFQMGHSIRRVQHDRMPWDFTNTHGEQGVPFPGRHPVQQMPLDGPDSPYFSGGSIDGANIIWEGRIGDPTTYVQPVEPTVSPDPLAQQDYYPALSF